MSTSPLWRETPLIPSFYISQIIGCSAFLKLENTHPSHAYKYRGMCLFAQRALAKHGPSVHLVVASGGNAGLAVACAAHALGVKCTVFIPEGVSQSTLKLLKGQNAEVMVKGRFYKEAVDAANEVVQADKHAVWVSAYDDPILWEGHASMVHEIQTQLGGKKPDALFCSVGGGGLLGGLIVGCKDVGWDDVPIVTLETIGSNCFHHSMSLNGEEKKFALPEGVHAVHDQATDVELAHFTGFSSKASGSLGASQPSAPVVKMALERKGGVKSASVPDELSMQAAALFADDHKLLVELACSTTLTAGYKRVLFDRLVPEKTAGEERVVVFVVCGGFKISLEELGEYAQVVKDDIDRDPEGAWEVICEDGDRLKVPKATSG